MSRSHRALAKPHVMASGRKELDGFFRIDHALGLGSVALVSLAEAREQALANRKLARSGGDPLAEKRRSVGIPTFAEAARRVVEQKRAGWRSRAQGRDWMLTFERYAFPRG